MYELSSGKAYVWNDPKETDIRNDLGQDRTGEPVFFTCPVGDINFKGDELSDIDQYPRSIWISSEKDEEIPTVTSKNALLYISDTKVPEEIVFERFADYGYSIGISNMEPDGGGHYYITYAETNEDDYKYSVDMKSEAAQVTQFDTIDRLFLDKVGGTEVNEETVSEGGTVLGLAKMSLISVSFTPEPFIRILCLLPTFTVLESWSGSYATTMSFYMPTVFG